MDSLFAPEPEDSTSESRSSVPTTDASPPSKKIRKPRSGSASVSRRPRSLKMSFDSMDDASTESWIASLRAGRASLTPSPEDGRESRTSDGSGPTSSAFSTSAEPLSSSEKTSAESCGTPIALLTRAQSWMTPQTTLWGEWEPFSGIWPRWGLCALGEVYEQVKWAPRTGGIEPSFWPTARAEDSESSGCHRDRNPDTLTSATSQWPTPQQRDEKNPNQPNSGNWKRKEERGFTIDLNDVAAQWQTPRCPNGGRVLDEATTANKGIDANGNKRTVDLSNQAEYWNTPTARDQTTVGPEEDRRYGTDLMLTRDQRLRVQAEHWPTPSAICADDSQTHRSGARSNELLLTGMAAKWPTPTAMDCEQAGGQGDYRGESLHLSASNWPTPNTRDAASAARHTTTTGVMHDGTSLTDATREWPTPKAESHDGMRGTDLRHGRVLDEEASHWPTPRVTDVKGGERPLDEQGRRISNGVEYGANLADKAIIWPTPTTTDVTGGPRKYGENGRRISADSETGSHFGQNLADMAREWPTPAERDYKSGETIAEYGNARPLSELAAQWRTPHTRDWHPQGPREDHDQRQLCIADQAATWEPPDLWRTPDAMPGGGCTSPLTPEEMAEKGQTVHLALQAQHWHTPTTQETGRMWNPETLQRRQEEGRFAQPGLNFQVSQWDFSSLPARQIHAGLPFSTRVRILLQLCRQLRLLLPSPYRKASSIFRRKLNPDFADWLMQWPVGFSSVDRDFSASEMESYLFNARRHLQFLLGDWEF